MVFKTNYRLMQVKCLAECSIKLPFVIKIFVLSIFEWPFYTRFTVLGEIIFLKKLQLYQYLMNKENASVKFDP